MRYSASILAIALLCVCSFQDADSQPWTYANTGVNHTIIISASVNPTIEGAPMTSGDYIGVFFDNSGSPTCAGCEMWTGSSTSISAFGDDPTTAGKDGFANAEVFQWKVWRHGDQKTFDVSVSYAPAGGIVTNTNTYAVNGISSVLTFSAPLPIQLVSFTATVQADNGVGLDWATATEINNYGFSIQKSPAASGNFQSIPNSFIPGNGTTLSRHEYHFVDNAAAPGIWYYRLEQIDLDGSVHYSEAVRTTILTSIDDASKPREFILEQNFPNPFNPTTTVRYSLPHRSTVSLTLHNALSQEIAQLVRGDQEQGTYDVRIDGTGLASGVYFLRLEAGSMVQTRKLVLMK